MMICLQDALSNTQSWLKFWKKIINQWLNKYGKNMKCTGQLPTEISAVGKYHIDPSHCHWVYGLHLYKLKKLTEMKKTDCKCLICNFGYAIKQNHEKSYEEFENAMKAALKHHFNNHDFCNPSWCHFKEDLVCKSADTNRAKLRNINMNPANKIVYEEVKNSQFLYNTWELTNAVASLQLSKEQGIEPRICKASSKETLFFQNVHIVWPSCFCYYYQLQSNSYHIIIVWD